MDKRSNVLSNILWRFGERVCAQVVSFVVTVVIARILDPEAFGVIAMVNVFIEFADVLVASGFGSAVIQKKDADELDYSSAFFFQLALSLLFYVIIFFAAPSIQTFYGNRYLQLSTIVRVLGLRVFLVALNSMQNAYTSKHLQYKKFFYATIVGTVISAIVGITAACFGFGVWALVMQYLTNSIIDTIVLWITVEWHPTLCFSFRRLRVLYSFGWKMLAAALVDIGYRKMNDFLIGKMYSPSDLAFYNRGSSYPNLIVSNINTSIDNVLFPVMSNAQDSRDTIKAMAQKSIKTSAYIMYPMMMGLAICGDPIIRLMLTEKWLPAVPFLRFFCFIYALQPINTANTNAIKAMGRSDLYLKLGVMKDAVGIVLLFIAARYGVFWIAVSGAISGIINAVINAFPNRKLLDYRILEQIKDVLPPTILSTFMGVLVWLIGTLDVPDLAKLCIQVPVGVIVYVCMSVLFKVDSFQYILSTIMRMIKNERAT